jgi:hypothetical protein
MRREVVSSVISLLVLLVGYPAVAQDTYKQTPAQMKGNLQKATKKDKPVEVVLNKKVDGQKKYVGRVKNVLDDSFEITDEQTNQIRTFLYVDVKEVRGKGWPVAAKIGVGAGIGAAVLFGIYSGMQSID